MALRAVITGSGRCGTGYMAMVLRSANVKCGHEAIFTPPVSLAETRIRHLDLDMESSWMAAPFLPRVKSWGVTTVHLVRNPLHTVHSLMSVGMLTRKSPYLSFAQLQMPALNLYRSSADRALAFYLVWNKRIEDYVDIRWKVEDDPRGLLDFLGVPHEGVGLFDNRQYNHRPEYPRKRIDWDEVNPVLADAFTRITRRYGYPT